MALVQHQHLTGVGMQVPAPSADAASVAGVPWLILPDALIDLAAMGEASRFVGSSRGRGGEMLPYRRTEEGVAIISIMGPLSNRAGWYGSSYEALQYQLSAAGSDPQTSAIVLDIDSPGGQAAGAFETAALVRALAGDKPVVAVVNSMAASAAYAIASAASHVVTTPTGMSGSIGVVMLHTDYSRMLDQAGVKPTLLFAGARKVDGNPYEPLSDAARTALQGEIDKLYGQFVETVAAGRRGMSAAKIRATEAGVFSGADAVAAGLADSVGTFDDALRLATDRRRRRAAPGMRAEGDNPEADAGTEAGAEETPGNATTDAAEAAAQEQRQMDEKELEQARADAVATERARTAAVMALPEAKGHESVAATLASKGLSADDAKEILAGLPKPLAGMSLEARAGGFNPDVRGEASATGADKRAEVDKGWADIAASLNRQHAHLPGFRIPQR